MIRKDPQNASASTSHKIGNTLASIKWMPLLPKCLVNHMVFENITFFNRSDTVPLYVMSCDFPVKDMLHTLQKC